MCGFVDFRSFEAISPDWRRKEESSAENIWAVKKKQDYRDHFVRHWNPYTIEGEWKVS